MKKTALLFMGLLCMVMAYAQKISYVVSFPNIVHHEANISLSASGLPVAKSAIFRMSRSSPGRYATHEFGKNIYDVKAFDKAGKAITINRIDGDVYEVPKHDGFVKVEYTLYANYGDGTYAGVDQQSVHLNMPATFMWVKDMDKAPIDIKFNMPEGKKWTIATQLKTTSDPTAFTAPGLQYFMDSPTKMGNLIWKEWLLKNPNGKGYQFRLALEAQSTDTLAGTFAAKVARIVKEAQAVYGEVPDYDYGTYTFIASINPYVYGDGMEHRNSTMISNSSNFDGANRSLGVFAHEFFHCWNVERIRPKTLEPFNFEKSNMSNELWCAEGFTQYYGGLLMKRAGFTEEEGFLRTVAGLINTKENTQGAKRYSPAAVSRHAVFVDAGVAVDNTNYPNMYTSYYPYGGAIALALDLTLRTKFKNLTLDNYMTALWKKFGKTELPYTIPGLQQVLAEVTGDAAFATAFFSKYVTGNESLDYKPLLAKAGLLLKKSEEGKPWLGNIQFKNGTTIGNNTIIGTPLYEAGLDIDDQLVQINGQPVVSLSELLKTCKVGDKLNVEYKHRGETMSTTVIVGENPAFAVSTYEKEGMTVTEDMKSFRTRWINSQVE
ncbi:MAG: M61 family peptidase [Chitinophagaceae bacterium]